MFYFKSQHAMFLLPLRSKLNFRQILLKQINTKNEEMSFIRAYLKCKCQNCDTDLTPLFWNLLGLQNAKIVIFAVDSKADLKEHCFYKIKKDWNTQILSQRRYFHYHKKRYVFQMILLNAQPRY